MKRARISKVTDSNLKRDREETGEVSHILTQYSGSSFSGLPRDILLNILLRLSVKRIVIFKCVCKSWYDLVSDPEFAKLHFDKAQVCPLIRSFGSKLVHLLQPDKDDFELKLGMCDHTHTKPGCFCNLQVKIDTKIEMPGRYGLMKHFNNYNILTCNGLLCLSNIRLSPIVCNPITGEFISIPMAKKFDYDERIRYGFGFSPLTNQYKVLRMSANKDAEAHIYILGRNTWKKVDPFIDPFNEIMRESSPTYLNGFLYWTNIHQLLAVCSFDVEKETFGSFFAPTADQAYKYYSMGVLGGQLYICRVLSSGDIHVWTMKDNGVRKEWSKVFSFDPIYVDGRWDHGPWLPIKYLNDGALLMFYSPRNAFVYMDPKENRFRYLKVRQSKTISKVKAIDYFPSFISLKRALPGHNVRVLNVQARWAKMNRHKEADIEIVEEDFHVD